MMGMRGTMMRFGLALFCVVNGRCMMVTMCWLTVLPTVCSVLLDVLTCCVLLRFVSFGWQLLCSSRPDSFDDGLVRFENYHNCHTCDNSNMFGKSFDLLIIQSSVQDPGSDERSPGRKLSRW